MKPLMYWKVGNTYTTDYDQALSIIELCNRDKNDYGIERD
jgi:hypothetical protein